MTADTAIATPALYLLIVSSISESTRKATLIAQLQLYRSTAATCAFLDHTVNQESHFTL